jgi:uncharacterized protein YdiU (UPF0061 family)
MSSDQNPTTYRPGTPIEALADWLGDPVEPADFPQTLIRYRNDRAASAIGLSHLSDADWRAHFGRFEPLERNLPQPLALRYHGHQFRNYNPEIGDGRGFLFAQMRDDRGRMCDLGTKGSGQTPWSRSGDGRLTLLGAVREVLATETLEALGVYTSQTLSVIETGEALERSDEPSPARSAVLTRLSHGHIRFGTFQRLLALEKPQEMAQLVEYCLEQFPGPPPPEDAPARDEPAVILLHQVVERMADLAASLMVAGFVHGVLNTDNMNISGECFDYGPWRFLPRWDPGFTAAYFDHQGLYAFGRQPEAIHWNCGQLAVALRALSDAPPLIAALERFGPLYMQAVGRRWCWRLGLEAGDDEANAQLVSACEEAMRQNIPDNDRQEKEDRSTAPQPSAEGLQQTPDHFFHAHRGGRAVSGALAEAFAPFTPITSNHQYWKEFNLLTLLVDDVEKVWRPIMQDDDWTVFQARVKSIRELGKAHGPPPDPRGHLRG